VEIIRRAFGRYGQGKVPETTRSRQDRAEGVCGGAAKRCFVITAASRRRQNQRDKMCFRSTAGTPETPGQAPPDTRELATLLLPFCYPFATPEAFRAAGCYPFATHLLSNCYHSLFAFHHLGTLAMYTSPRRKGAPSESRSSLRAAHLR